MHAPSNLVLLVIAAVALAMVGCASQPKQDEPARVAKQAACEDQSNPLHLTTLRKKEVPHYDPQLESLLTEGGDWRLQSINREMYETLHALDDELRREQEIAACERGDSDIHSLQAHSTPAAGGSNAAGGGSTSAGGAAAGGGFGLSGTTVAAASGANSAAAPGGGTAAGSAATTAANSSGGLTATSTAAAAAKTTLVRKASVPPTTTASGGNGATTQKISSGSDNDIVARRLRKAAEQETDPAVKARLWKEYAQYQQGNAAK